MLVPSTTNEPIMWTEQSEVTYCAANKIEQKDITNNNIEN